MKFIFVSILITTLYISNSISAQSNMLNWDSLPKPHQVHDAYANDAAVVILDQRWHQYQANDKEGLTVVVTNHRIIKVNNEKGVEQFNKIFLPVSYDGSFLEIKARVITPTGKVIDLPKEKILEEEAEGRMYKKFALEGVESGSEIEYISVEQKRLYFFGLEVFQYAAPCQLAEFRLSVPAHLVFDVKGYNGFLVDKDSVMNGVRFVRGRCINIPVLEDEKYGQVAPYFKNIQYKLSYNLGKEKEVRLFTWNELAKNVFDSYSFSNEKEIKAVVGFIKNIPIDKKTSEESKIVAVEDYLKNNISINEEGIGEDADKIEKIIKTSVASHDGLNKLFAACMTALGIQFEMVFPSKRNDIPLDSTLENYRLINDLVFYFPSTGHFLEATNIGLRYPFIQPYWAATSGLFLQQSIEGNVKTASASFRAIPIQPYEKNTQNIEVLMKFNESMDSIIMHSKQLFTGYGASMYRPAFHFLPKDKIQDFTQEVIQSISKSKNITNIQVHNTAMTEGLSNKPLIFEGDISSGDLVEQAGKKLLLKIGDVIGPQEQMYQEKPRQLPISMEYPHTLDRKIVFEIPNGYSIKNPDDLLFDITASPKSTASMGFVSTYTISDNKLVVSIHEYYQKPNYPIEQFAVFQQVINAAADFNKVVLVLEKK